MRQTDFVWVVYLIQNPATKHEEDAYYFANNAANPLDPTPTPVTPALTPTPVTPALTPTSISEERGSVHLPFVTK